LPWKSFEVRDTWGKEVNTNRPSKDVKKGCYLYKDFVSEGLGAVRAAGVEGVNK